MTLTKYLSIDKHRKRKNLLRRSYLKKVKCVRQNYKPEDVLAAMRAIWRGMSRRQAAKVFNIPRSTLLDKLDGKRPVDASPGPNPFLTKAEERTLESWAIDLHRRGFPLKTEDLKDMAQAVIQSNQRRTSFKNGRPGRSWMRNFLLRHPKVYEISTDMTPGPRRSRTVTTREEVRQWCQHHRYFMSSIGHESILDYPDRIFSVDHGEFLFDSTTGHFLEQNRDRIDGDKPEHNDSITAGTECVSTVAAFAAAGGIAPLMFVYPSKYLSDGRIDPLPPGWIAAHSESGFLNGNIFLNYIVSFRNWLEQEHVTFPVLLLVDGRRSRLNMDVTRYCEEQGIILYCLFPTPRPAISEVFGSVLHESADSLNKFNFATRLHEALETLGASASTHNLPHLQSMLQTMAEVRAEPLICPVSPTHHLVGNDYQENPEPQVHPGEDESDCEFDSALTPIEGEIEIEIPFSENSDPYTLALHPALSTDPHVPRYLVFKAFPVPNACASPVSAVPCTPAASSALSTHVSANDTVRCFEDRVDQPDIQAHLIVKPLSSPLPETGNGIALLESEIDDVLGTLLSMGVSHQVESSQLLPNSDSNEEPFLGFSSDDIRVHQSKLDAHGCLRFLEKILVEKGLLEDFKAAQFDKQWNGVQEAKFLFDAWLTASDECNKVVDLV
ncbi:hypothetical protein ONE63_009710 [Megalurothrips usitatus]|uniref:HTH CENPB-type domain-containing protein n=1 Tax=Megalurothrips usitatus TaxID=439358 RepID=A0AAV7XHF0_9NEOP|nr:hypothetical protein ONE63_009710 [Megalurothrips usitatus]